jgi:hypothetical protein
MASGEAAEPLQYTVSESFFCTHALHFPVISPGVLLSADHRAAGVHPLRGLQEEGQEGAPQHRRYVCGPTFHRAGDGQTGC